MMDRARELREKGEAGVALSRPLRTPQVHTGHGWFRMACVCAVALVMSFASSAFFPFGGFQELDNRMVFARWAFEQFDRNGDGQVTGPLDGLEIVIEGGPNGFTNAEQLVVRQSFSVWEDIPGAYAKFRYTEPVSDPLIPGAIDLISYVSISLPGEPAEFPFPAGVLGVALLNFTIEDTFLEARGFVVEVEGGQMIDADIVINGATTRPEFVEEGDFVVDLKGVMVHEVGHFLGLGHTPLNNFIAGPDGLAVLPLEDPVLTVRTASGDLSVVGVTPTMFPFLFGTNVSDVSVIDGAADLAPDDIAAAMFLYPRVGELDSFFTVRHEARTRTRPGFPTLPLLGAHITAWVDHDNNPSTGRVPIISTMTGLYVNNAPQAIGRFDMIGLPKQLLNASGIPFNANYVFTMSPLNGLDFAGQSPFILDVMHNNNPGVDDRDAGEYDVIFASEVFREEGNMLDMSNMEQGTPLYFDPIRRAIVSLNSGKSLGQLLPAPHPMFGQAVNEEICIMDIIILGEPGGGGGGGDGVGGGLIRPAMFFTPKAIRGFRDDVLMKHAAGIAVVDAYYRLTPAAAHALLANQPLLVGSRLTFRALDWAFSSLLPVLLAGLFLVGVLRGWRWRRAAAAGIALAVLFGSMDSAHGLIKFMTTEEMVKSSSDIVTGRVRAVDSYFKPGTQVIVSDIVIDVDDIAKGTLNKNTGLVIQVPGGRVGGLVSRASEFPVFRPGEEILIFLEHSNSFGHLVTAGARGKFQVITDRDSGEKYLMAGSAAAQIGLDEAVKALKGESDDESGEVFDGRVKLDDMMNLIRQTAAKQAKAEAEASEE